MRIVFMKEIIHEFEIRVRYEETDKMGIVYSGKYFVYFEVGRTELLRSFGKSYRQLEETGIGLPVVETYCRHRKPATYDDLLVIRTKAALKKSLLRFDYEIRLKGEKDILSEGYTIHLFMNDAGKIVTAPDYIKEIF